MVNCVHKHWFLEVVLSPCSHFHHRTVVVCNAVLPQCTDKRGCQTLTFGLVPVRTEISPDFQNLLMISCTLGDESFKAFTILQDLFWNCLTIFRFSFSKIGKPLPSVPSETLHSSSMPSLYPLMSPVLLAFPPFSCPCPSFFKFCCHQTQTEKIIFHGMVKCLTFNIWCFLCSAGNKIGVKFSDHWIIVLLTFHTVSQLV